MAAKRTCGRYVTPFNCIFVSVVPVILFRLFWWFRWFRSGGFVSVFLVLVHALYPVVVTDVDKIGKRMKIHYVGYSERYD